MSYEGQRVQQLLFRVDHRGKQGYLAIRAGVLRFQSNGAQKYLLS